MNLKLKHRRSTSDRWVGAVWPVDRWCRARYQPVASSPKRLYRCTRGTL